MEEFYLSGDIEHLAEIVANRLYFGVTYSDTTKTIKNTQENFYFTIDDELLYLNYYYDFGPLNLSCLYKYCCKLNSYMQSAPTIKRVIHYTSRNEEKRTNAAYLIGAYAVIFMKMEPKQVMRVLLNAGGAFRHFVDASQGISQHTIRILDCLNGIEKAHKLNFFNFEDFNAAEYDLYDKLQNGDLNWLVPRKFLAFIGPTDDKYTTNGHSPEFYLKYFLQNDVQAVVRLNNKVYDSSVFSAAGLNHHELFFPDGTTPPKNILQQFLDIAEHCPTALAVHCKAGLGRTGSLIGAYIMKHYHLTAREAIAWMRICRPGSVIGQQQGWLEKIEGWLWRQGGQYRLHNFGDGDKLPHHKYGIYSIQWPIERKRLIHLAHRRATSVSRQSARARIEQSDEIERKITSSCKQQTPQKYGKTASADKSYRTLTKMISPSKNSAPTQSNVGSLKIQPNYYEKIISTDRTRKRNKEPSYEYYPREKQRVKPPYDNLNAADKSVDYKVRKFLNFSGKSDKDVESDSGSRPFELPFRRKPQSGDLISDILNETQGDKLNKIKNRRTFNSQQLKDYSYKEVDQVGRRQRY